MSIIFYFLSYISKQEVSKQEETRGYQNKRVSKQEGLRQEEGSEKMGESPEENV